jgi:hypothetical protein
MSLYGTESTPPSVTLLYSSSTRALLEHYSSSTLLKLYPTLLYSTLLELYSNSTLLELYSTLLYSTRALLEPYSTVPYSTLLHSTRVLLELYSTLLELYSTLRSVFRGDGKRWGSKEMSLDEKGCHCMGRNRLRRILLYSTLALLELYSTLLYSTLLYSTLLYSALLYSSSIRALLYAMADMGCDERRCQEMGRDGICHNGDRSTRLLVLTCVAA